MKKILTSSVPQVNPCKHNATCEDKIDDFFCKCNIGYMGKMCQAEINECDPGNICMMGVCSDLFARGLAGGQNM